MSINNSINAASNSPLKAVMGGLGVSSPTAHGILIGEGSNPVSSLILGAGQLLIGTTSNDPATASLTSTGGTIAVTASSGAISLDVANVTVAHGGTGLTSVTQNAFLFGNGTSALGTVLLSSGQFLFTGTANSPTYGSLTSSDNSHSITVGANTLDIGLNTVSVAKGGTGSTSLTANSILIGNGGGAVASAALASGQILIGSTGNAPVASVLTAGSGIAITSTAGSISIAATNQMPIEEDTGNKQMVSTSYTYMSTSATAQVVFTLPTTVAQGTLYRIVGKGAGGWKVAQNSGQTIYFGVTTSTTGASGYMQSTLQRDVVEILCITANTEFQVIYAVGNIDLE